MAQNGTPPKPAITIFWDNEAQVCQMKVDSEQLKNPSMVEALLNTCLESAKFTCSVARAQGMQQQMMQAAQMEALRNKIIQH